MENNHVIDIDEEDGVETSMNKNMESSLGSLNYNCSIYKIPEFIRRENKESYRPIVISIGPVYYQDPQLQTMQLLKWIYLESFLKHPKNAYPTLKPYINIVRNSLGEIRQHYQQQLLLPLSLPPSTHIDDDEFIQMIVLDAIFLLSSILRLDSNSEFYFPICHEIPREVINLWDQMDSDLFLGENQVPFLVLKNIFYKSFSTEQAFLLIDLTRTFITNFRNFLGSNYVANMDNIIDADALSDAAHILDFYWRCCYLPYHTTHPKQEKVHHFPFTAKCLSDAGVQFKVTDSSRINPLIVTFNNRTGELHLPKLIIADSAEAFMRNILFFEQCHYNEKLSFVDLVAFLKHLINDVDDVQVLLKTGIIENYIGSAETVLNFFKNIAKDVVYNSSNFNYSSVSQEVNKYANKRRNRWRAILLRDYFNHPWSILSFIFAVILFILTLLQTIAAFTNN